MNDLPNKTLLCAAGERLARMDLWMQMEECRVPCHHHRTVICRTHVRMVSIQEIIEERLDRGGWKALHMTIVDQTIAVIVIVDAVSGQDIVNAPLSELNDAPMSGAAEKVVHLVRKEKSVARVMSAAVATSEEVNAMAAVDVIVNEKEATDLHANHAKAGGESAALATMDEVQAQAAKIGGAEAEEPQMTEGSEPAILRIKDRDMEMRSADARIALAEGHLRGYFF